MTSIGRLASYPVRLHGALGAPGVIIGLLSMLSFGFGLVVLVAEYHGPTKTGRAALHRIFAGWLRHDDYLGYTLADHADRWRLASPADRPAREKLLRKALADLGDELTRHDAQFRMIRVIALDLGPRDQPPIASWRPGFGPSPGVDEKTDRVVVTDENDGHGPPIELAVGYRVAPEVAEAFTDVETSYHRLLLALLGLSGYSLLCLAYMVLHARAQRERVAREAASAATLDLADRTCHELGNVAFVVANERRNLASHIDLLERFVAEDATAHLEAARRAGLDPATIERFDHALRREYAARGIDPEFELRGSATIARDVCRQIAVSSDYIALTVRELDGYLKRTTLPVEVTPMLLAECVDDALALLAPRIEATDARIERGMVETSLRVLADRSIRHRQPLAIRQALDQGRRLNRLALDRRRRARNSSRRAPQGLRRRLHDQGDRPRARPGHRPRVDRRPGRDDRGPRHDGAGDGVPDRAGAARVSWGIYRNVSRS